MNRLIDAICAFWRVLTGTESSQLDKPTTVSPTAPPAAERPVDADRTDNAFDRGAVYALVLLQRHGRLVDFLQEDISSYSDEQVGAAVRPIHAGCRTVLRETIVIDSVRPEAEGESLRIESNYDPSLITLTGNVPEKPPFKGTLRHKGWRAKELRFSRRSGAGDPRIVQPAELEIS